MPRQKVLRQVDPPRPSLPAVRLPAVRPAGIRPAGIRPAGVRPAGRARDPGSGRSADPAQMVDHHSWGQSGTVGGRRHSRGGLV